MKKICIDGGFTCPNRDGTRGQGGCVFCGERGAGEHIPICSIEAQVCAALENAGDDELFVAYFQNFSNTYADLATLKERYDRALTDKRIVALAIGTRPDCIDEEKAKLIASYKQRCAVWVELGLQSSDDETGRIINRGYTSDEFTRAVMLLTDVGVDTVGHMIVGLPSEGEKEAQKTASFIVKSGVKGIKIHSIYVMKDTELAKMYDKRLYTPPTMEEYVSCVARIIASLPDDIIIHRITGDCPRDMLVAPKWNADKNKVISEINSYMSAMGWRQGSLYDRNNF